jgi:hypothetical protein
MITKYTTYKKIFEELSIDINLVNDKLQEILKEINNEFNYDIFYTSINSHSVLTLYCKMTSIMYKISIDKMWCYLFCDNNNLIQREKFSNYELILNTIKTELIFKYLFDIFSIDYWFFKKDMSYDEFMNIFGTKDFQIFFYYYKKNSLPKYIIKNYKYLINANNFDLI